MASGTWLTELPGSPRCAGTRQEAGGVDRRRAGCDRETPWMLTRKSACTRDTACRWTALVRRVPPVSSASPGCHQASYPLSLAKGPPGGCRQEITRGGLWAWNGRLPRPALPAGMFPSSEFSGLDCAGRAATLHKGRGRHSRGMLRAHLGWFSSYLRVSLSHFLS